MYEKTVIFLKEDIYEYTVIIQSETTYREIYEKEEHSS